MRKIIACVVLGAMILAGLSQSVRSQDATLLRLGLASSLFRDVRESMIDLAVQPMSKLLISQAGVPGKVDAIVEAQILAQQLDEKKLDMAVMHGVEFAWARQKYPELKPLLVVNNGLKQKAVLVVSKSSTFMNPEDLKGKILSLPRRCKEHLHLFMQRRCTIQGKTPGEFFARLSRPLHPEYALNEVARGECHAALVDLSQLEAYQTERPERAAKLRVLLESEIFPAGVIVYRQGGTLSSSSLERIKNGLLHLHEVNDCKDLLTLCNMKGFDLPPNDFNHLLETIARSYPSLGGN